MARRIEKLTALSAERLKAPGYYGDGAGLYLQVSPSGSKSWIFRFKFAGRPREMGLGSYLAFGLSEARERATRQRQLLADGVDPIAARDAAKQATALAAAKKVLTFDEEAADFIATEESGWKSAKHAQQWRNTIAVYASPVIGHIPARDIDTDLVVTLLQPIWKKKPETASRLRGRIEKIIARADKKAGIERLNPARWEGHLEVILRGPSRHARIEHHPALPYAQLGDFMAELRTFEGVAPLATEFIVLTCVRTSAAIGAHWREVDLEEKVWTVPAARMKGKKGKAAEHRVPLSDSAAAVLQRVKELTGSSDFVFPGRQAGKPLSNMACLAVLERMNTQRRAAGLAPWIDSKSGKDIVVHGFRSTFNDWASEQTAYPHEVIEKALAHAVKDKTEAAYRRGDLFDKRAKLMADWARYCARPSGAQATVTPIRKNRAGR